MLMNEKTENIVKEGFLKVKKILQNEGYQVINKHYEHRYFTIRAVDCNEPLCLVTLVWSEKNKDVTFVIESDIGLNGKTNFYSDVLSFIKEIHRHIITLNTMHYNDEKEIYIAEDYDFYDFIN